MNNSPYGSHHRLIRAYYSFPFVEDTIQYDSKYYTVISDVKFQSVSGSVHASGSASPFVHLELSRLLILNMLLRSAIQYHQVGLVVKVIRYAELSIIPVSTGTRSK